jgi:hypothetical protein
MTLLLQGTKVNLASFARAAFVTSLVAAIVSGANASVIINDAAVVPNPFFPPGYQLTLTQSIPPGMGLFAINIEDLGSGDYRFSYAAIAEFYSLHNATFGLSFSANYVAANLPLVSNSPTGPFFSILNFAPNESKYLAYWDDRTPFDNTPGANDNYGWVRVTRTGNALVASESVTAIGGGIQVGTSTQIPEPSAMALLLVTSVLVLAKGREKRPVR